MDVINQIKGEQSKRPDGNGFGQHVSQRPRSKSKSGQGLTLRGSVGAGLANAATHQLQKTAAVANDAKAFIHQNNTVLAEEIKSIVNGDYQAMDLYAQLAEVCQDVAPVDYPEMDFSEALEAVAGLGKLPEIEPSANGEISFLPPGVG